VTATGLERLQSLLDASLARQTQAPAVCTPAGDLDPRLHAYQVKAVQHLRDHPQAGLFLEMGLGKTAATLQALTPEHLPVLVVAPKRVAAQVWPVETPKWRPDLTLALAAGDPAKRAKALAAGADITVIGRDNIKDIRPGQFRTVVIDELSGFKSRGVRWQTARKIVDAAAYVWGLTGTPTPNGYMDLWAQVHLLDGGAALGKTLGSADPKFARKGSFRDRYFTPTRFHRITAGFLYGEEGEPTTVLHRDKIAAALEVVQGTGSPVLTFYRYVWEREALQAAMLAEGIDVRTIDEPGVVEAWNRGEVEVLLAHPASAGHGLNLQHGGHTILWTSKEWSLELWEQGNGRINRQGQTHPVLIHSLVTPDSVDEAINARLSGKATVQEALMMVLRGEDDE
jgi:SNF2 family DNA or RNA helicase